MRASDFYDFLAVDFKTSPQHTLKALASYIMTDPKAKLNLKLCSLLSMIDEFLTNSGALRSRYNYCIIKYIYTYILLLLLY